MRALAFRILRHNRRGFLLRCLVLILCIAPLHLAAEASDPYKPAIPRPGSGTSNYAGLPGCAGLDASNKATAFGFTVEDERVEAGAIVATVSATGPAEGWLLPGDTIVSVNGMVMTDDRGGKIRAMNPFDNFLPERGAYIYGLRDGDPFEALIAHCSNPKKRYPFGGPDAAYTFHALYPEHDAPGEKGKLFDPRIALAGFLRAKMEFRDDERRNKYAPTRQGYCRLREIEEISYTQKIISWRSQYGVDFDIREREYARVMHVDAALFDAYMKNFDFIHNDVSRVVSSARGNVAWMIRQYGCASPEFKDFERRIYGLFGQRWP